MSTNEQEAALNRTLLEAVDKLAQGLASAARLNRRTCVHCLQFDPKTEGCHMAGGQRPPAPVIAFGCPKFEDDIPF
jgi:hypothetical protein